MLIDCKECNNKVSDKAISCPNCGNVLNKASVKNDGCFIQTLNIGCGIFLIIFLKLFKQMRVPKKISKFELQ